MKDKLKRMVNATWLCIKYPFLWPRNRFTDEHYNNWKIIEFHRKWWKHTSDTFFIRIMRESEAKAQELKLILVKNFEERSYRIWVSKDNLVTITPGEYPYTVLYSKPLSEFGYGKAVKCGWLEDSNFPVLVVEDTFDIKQDKNTFVEIVHAKWLRRLIKFFDWINKYPLQLLHCIPEYTELDAMPTGWRKAFGLQMCKEIKQELLKTKGHMRDYRIDQIKEKYGGLRWYDHNTTEGVQRIIRKYEALSYVTCVDCGKPATKISKGWICPYCDDCIGDRQFTVLNKENYEDSSVK